MAMSAAPRIWKVPPRPAQRAEPGDLLGEERPDGDARRQPDPAEHLRRDERADGAAGPGRAASSSSRG